MRRGLLAMLASVVLYTCANLCVKELSDLGTFQLVFLRSALSLAVCVVYLKANDLPILGHNRMWLVIRGLAGMVGLSGFFHTVRHIPLASATVIQYFSPVFTVVLALLFMGEKVQRKQWLLLGGALVGIIMVKGFDPRVSWGMWGLGLMAAAAAAVAYLATMKCRDSDHPVGVVVWFHLLAFPITGALSMPQWMPMTTPMWGLAALVGLLSIAAQILMTVALHQEDAGMVMPFKYLGAVMALSAGWVLYGETMSSLSLLGMGLAVVCIATNTWIKSRSHPASS